MQALGKVVEWNDERGFGFINPVNGDTPGTKLFFHIRDYRQQGRRPEVGELVRYRAQQSDGKWKAVDVHRAAARTHVSASPSSGSNKPGHPRPISFDILLVAVYLLGVGWTIHRGHPPVETWFFLVAAWLFTYIAYAVDKHAAQKNARRIPEQTLHLLELSGGWPAALFAQRTLRHKTRKPSYRIVFWLMVALHLAALAGWAFWHP